MILPEHAKKGAKALDAVEKKQNGVVYTPESLANYMVKKLFNTFIKDNGCYRILDPACGDGELLEATARYAKKNGIEVKLFGFDTDAGALAIAKARLEQYDFKFKLSNTEFLEFCLNNVDFKVDGVIANPPYVRTQVLGGDISKEIAKNFHLSGKIDLYQAFYAALPYVLSENGGISVITSNKFIMNKTGADLRKFLINNFHIDLLIDLGDTKLFDAAVLPAIVVGNKELTKHQSIIDFYRIYEATSGEKDENFENVDNVYLALDSGQTGFLSTDTNKYHATTGKVNIPENPKDVWALATDEEYAWAINMKKCFGSVISDFGKVRVGIKTTADNVFIKDSWEHVEPHPEDELIHPLYSAKKSHRWFIEDEDAKKLKKILYPMQVGEGRKKANPINLEDYPKTAKYLAKHYEQLSGRSYVINAGREWFEIWVPQDPKLWQSPKIIFPDISEIPKFMIDMNGMYVDGNCYWIVLDDDVPEDYLYLIAGVANSKAMQKFHSIMFQNKLYSNKLRFVSQYVEKYPVPDLSSTEAKIIVKTVKKLLIKELTVNEAEELIEVEIMKILDGKSEIHHAGQQSLF
ncbi:Eco57I restriction-modification methylase domain-containing protein [Levilactobacillus sp. HBUAS70063]|uniref:Eco57I restriction-modification methylase domain-containing protein n=1 Tax=Levilactobacillus sp. HBUAS70063 TaxID=3109359 RepID=UPI003132DF1A